MGQITSGVGLISGINTGDLIDQLLAIERRPKQLIERRNVILNTQTVAFQDINAKLLAFKLASSNFNTSNLFRSTSSSSSSPDTVGISSGASATPGTYNLTVGQLVSTQQTITRGFADPENAPIGEGTLTFEFGNARLDSNTSLNQLNGGDGISRGKIRVTDRSGNTAIVDLGKALNANDVLDAINNADGISVRAAVQGDRFVLTDDSGATANNLIVTDMGTTGTATSLGIAQSVAADTLTGAQVNRIGQNTALSLLNDGNGVGIRSSVDDFRLELRDGSTFNINLAGATTTGDVFDRIAEATSGAVVARASASGAGLELEDTTAGGGTFTVTALNNSNAARDLGLLQADDDGDGIITSGRKLTALNSRLLNSLNGGSGVTLGEISVTNRAGTTTAIDLTGSQSVAEVLERINVAGAGVTAQLNSAGNGIAVKDNTGATASNLIIADNSGSAAADLGIAQTVSAATINSGNLQLQYVSEATRLDQLNNGAGIKRGLFTITDSAGVSANVDLTQGDETTIAHVLAEINSRGLAINARVNDNGDGILIEDTGPGTFALKVAEAGSTTARDLGLLGEASEPGEHFNGSFERTIDISATDTLKDVAQKINDAGLKVSASIINDGSGVNPFRLSLLGREGGSSGAFLFDDGGLGFGASNLVEAQDAVAFFGSADPAKAIAVTSTKNTLDSLIPGATISLKAPTSTPVTLSIQRDDSAIVDGVKRFVDGFNSIVDALNKYDKYDPETKERGALLGNSTLARVRSSLYRIANSRHTEVGGQYDNLAAVGITVGTGAKLRLNEEKFLAALNNDRESVQNLFALRKTEDDEDGKKVVVARGIGVKFDELLDNLTKSDGQLQSQLETINKQIESNRTRMTAIDAKLEQRRLILQTQFTAMERALAQMQDQASALASFQPIPVQSNN